jgi:hypothetical protein
MKTQKLPRVSKASAYRLEGADRRVQGSEDRLAGLPGAFHAQSSAPIADSNA